MKWIKKMLHSLKLFFRRMFSKKQANSHVEVVKIVNTLEDRAVTFANGDQEEFVLQAGETLEQVSNLHPRLLFDQGEISQETISTFQVEGDQNPCSFAVVDRVGIISALGTMPEDYNIYDKAFTYLSWAEIKAGQRIVLRVVIDSDQVPWVVGDLEDNI